MISWKYSRFEDLSREELHDIYQVRQSVFVVEQDCAYQDVDGLDPVSWHLMAWQDERARKELVAYLRIVAPGKRYREPSMGRILTASSVRGVGLGQELINNALNFVDSKYPGLSIRISAQEYLESFYSKFGFETISEPYEEDGIPHIEMVKKK